jgi:thiol-disulfide isomerase/thioredoxin
MLAFLTAVGVLAGALCVLNLVLTLGVVRRLREHAQLLAMLSPKAPNPMLSVGERVGSFEAVTVDGHAVSRDTLDGPTLLGIFSPDCSACAERLPRFVELAAGYPGGRERVLAVVVGDEHQAAAQVAALAPVARVVVEDADGQLSQATGVRGYPAFGVLDEGGWVRSASTNLDLLDVLVGA